MESARNEWHGEQSIPNLFMIAPSSGKKWLGSEDFGLHLICGSPGHFHLAKEPPYPLALSRSQEFISKVGRAHGLVVFVCELPLAAGGLLL